MRKWRHHDTSKHLDQFKILVDGLLLPGEAFLQLFWETGPAAIDGVAAAASWRS